MGRDFFQLPVTQTCFYFYFSLKTYFYFPRVSLKSGWQCPATGECSCLYFWGTCACVCVASQFCHFYRIKYLSHVKETVIMNYGSFARSDTKLVSGPVSNVGVNLWQTGYWWMVSKVCWICQPRLWMRIC